MIFRLLFLALAALAFLLSHFPAPGRGFHPDSTVGATVSYLWQRYDPDAPDKQEKPMSLHVYQLDRLQNPADFRRETRVLSVVKFDDAVSDVVSDYCGTVFAVGKFRSSRFAHIGRLASSDIDSHGASGAHAASLASNAISGDEGEGDDAIEIDLSSVRWSESRHDIPFFVLSYEVDRTAIKNAKTPFESVTLSHSTDYFSSISVSCGSMRYSPVNYCSIACDLYIAGRFTMMYKDNRNEPMVNAVRYSAADDTWYPVVGENAPEQLRDEGVEIVTIEKTEFGIVVSTRDALFLQKSDKDEWTKLMHFKEGHVKKVMQFYFPNGDHGFFFSGNFTAFDGPCDYICQYVAATGDVMLPRGQAQSVKGAVSDMLLDFHGSFDNDLYVAEQESMLLHVLNGTTHKWRTLIREPPKDATSGLTNIALCYENSISCYRTQGIVATTSQNGQLYVFDKDGNAMRDGNLFDWEDDKSKRPKMRLVAYHQQDDLLSIRMFNLPNRDKLMVNDTLNVYSDMIFPAETDYTCQFADSSSEAHMVDLSHVQCSIPVPLELPKNRMFLNVRQRIPSSVNHQGAFASYQRKLLYYDGEDRCQSRQEDLRYKLMNSTSVSIALMVIIMISALSAWVVLTFCLLLPCSCYENKVLESAVKSLDISRYTNDKDNVIRKEAKTVLGGFVSVSILFLFAIVGTYVAVDALDPFKTSVESYVSTMARPMELFNMQYRMNRTECDFTSCQERIIPDGKEITITNDSLSEAPAHSHSRNYTINVSTILYAEGNIYALTLDQCCQTMDLSPVAQLNIGRDMKARFEPAFTGPSSIDDYEKVALLQYQSIHWQFETYEHRLNRTSSIRLSSQWFKLRRKSESTFLNLLTDAVFNNRVGCLFYKCSVDLHQRDTDKQIFVGNKCFELGSGDNTTQIVFDMDRSTVITRYSMESLLAVAFMIVTSFGSMWALRGMLTGIVLSIFRKVNHHWFSHWKSLILLCGLVIFMLPSGLFLGSWIFVVQAKKQQELYWTDESEADNGGMSTVEGVIQILGLPGALLSAVLGTAAIQGTLNVMLVWNAGFLNRLRNMELFSPRYWKLTIHEPVDKMIFGFKHGRPWFLILAGLILASMFTPPPISFPTITLCMVLIWKTKLAGLYREKYDGKAKRDSSAMEDQLREPFMNMGYDEFLEAQSSRHSLDYDAFSGEGSEPGDLTSLTLRNHEESSNE